MKKDVIDQIQHDIGDTVYYVGTTLEKRQHPCPDCLRTKECNALSPAGVRYTFACPRCSAAFQSNHALTLNYTVYTPTVKRLTIGSIRFDSAHKENSVEYMCVETGIGTGSVYNQDKLYAKESDAIEAARLFAEKQTKDSDIMTQQYNDSLSLSDYELSNAAMKSAEKLKISLQVKYNYFISDLRECFDMG